MAEATTTLNVPTPPATPPAPKRRDPVTLFLWVGSALLVLGLLAFGVLYARDQFVPRAPSISEQGIAQAEAAVREAPNNVPARLTLGTLYAEAQRYGDAVAQFDEILKVDPVNQDAMMGKGYTLTAQGNLEGAAAEYNKVVTMSRSGEFAGADKRLQAAYYYLGAIGVKQGQPAKAVQSLSKALALSPTDSDALYQYGLAQAQLGKHKDAIAYFSKSLTFVPTGWCDPYPQLAASYTALSKPESATYAGAMGEFCTGKADAAKQQLTGLTSGPAAVDAMLGLGLIAQVQNDTDAALGWYRKVLQADPKNATAKAYLEALGSGSTKPHAAATPKK